MRIIILYLFVFFSLFGVNFAGLPVWTKTNFIVGIIGLGKKEPNYYIIVYIWIAHFINLFGIRYN